MIFTRQYGLSFTTPAFLGNAQQQAQWRTPPIKALLRQWWRVLAWQEMGDVERLRKQEGLWFGVAADEDGESRQSQVRIRLSTAWSEGKVAEWPKTQPLTHPNVKVPVQADLYLGFGPITTRSRRTAILPDMQARLAIAAPDEFPLDDLMRLVARFGTLGSRSRNGWGSLAIQYVENLPPALLQRISLPLADCLRQDWPHALGRDEEGLLIWKTRPQSNWREAMRELARIKIAFRSNFPFNGGEPHRAFQDRHLLAYPVTHHGLAGLGRDARNANQLRFKVVRDGEMFTGLAFHLPCALPLLLANGPTRQQQADIWRQVHAVLGQQMSRTGDGQ